MAFGQQFQGNSIMELINLLQYEPIIKMAPDVLYLKDQNDLDWYESQKLFSDSTMKIGCDRSGVILMASVDVSTLWPEGVSVFEVNQSKLPNEFKADSSYQFKDGKVGKRVLSQEEVIELADTQRSAMLRIISDRILPLQDALELDYITNDELDLLRTLKSIRVELSRLDTSKAPDIKWPVLPE